MNYSIAFCLFAAFLHAQKSFADTSPCGAETRVGDTCSISVLAAHPTQFSVGMLEVESKATEIQGMSKKELKKFLKKHTVPTIIGPHHEFYMTDHHHLARALYEAKVDEMNLDIQSDWSSLSDSEFWAKMESSNLVYLIDENGNGPHSTADLPATVAKLADDIYRGLEWVVQKQTGAFADSNTPYASFQWANFFRPRIPRATVEHNLDQAVKLGSELAQSPEASYLPGYIGPH